MAYEYGGWPNYVSVAERRSKAERALAKLKKRGHPVAPVRIEGRQMAATFWGKAWCQNLESYRDYETRLPRGRSYVRHGAVVDLQIAPGEVTAIVSGSSLYRVSVPIAGLPKAAWRAICDDCAGRIDSLVELLHGRLSDAVMERLCRQDGGLFPKPADIRFSCSCLDHAAMCKHVAAALYGVGARLDQEPELLFRLRKVDQRDLMKAELALNAVTNSPAAGRVLEGPEVAAIFGLDLAAAEVPAKIAGPGAANPAPRKRQKPVPAARTVRLTARASANAARHKISSPASANRKKPKSAGR